MRSQLHSVLAALALAAAFPAAAATLPTSATCKQNVAGMVAALGHGDYAATRQYFSGFGKMMFPPDKLQAQMQQALPRWGSYVSQEAPIDGNAPGGMPAVRVRMHFTHRVVDAYGNCDPGDKDGLVSFMADDGS